jgi:hypothetical protein
MVVTYRDPPKPHHHSLYNCTILYKGWQMSRFGDFEHDLKVSVGDYTILCTLFVG